MKIEETKKLTIEIEGTDIENLKSCIKKVCEDLSRVGFRNQHMTDDEAETLKKLKNALHN